MKRWLVPLIAVVLLSLSVHSPAQAQGSTTISDFMTASLGAQSHEVSASYPMAFIGAGGTGTLDGTSGGSWIGSGGNGGGGSITGAITSGSTSQAAVVIDLGAEYTITAGSLWGYLTSGSFSSGFWIIAGYDSSKTLVSYWGNNENLTGMINAWDQRTATGSIAGVRYVSFTIEYANGSSPPSLDDVSVTCDCPAPSGPDTSGFTMRPLALADQDTTFDLQDKPDTVASLFDKAYILTQWVDVGPAVLQGVSTAPDAYVHAIAPGVVVSVRPLDVATDCGLFDPHFVDSEHSGDNLTDLDNHQSANECWVMLANSDAGELLVQTFSGGEIVRVQYDDPGSGDTWYFDYVVDGSDNYIHVGDTVSPGCVLGLTIALDNPRPGEIDTLGFLDHELNTSPPTITTYPDGFIAPDFGAAAQAHSGKGIMAVSAFDYTQNAAGRLAPTEYPSNSTPCKSAQSGYADCKTNNPTFSNHGEGWSTAGDVTFTSGGGALLGNNSEAYQSFNFDNTVHYVLTLGLNAPAPMATSAFIGLGTEIYFANSDGASLTVTLDLPANTLSTSDFYNIGVQTGTADSLVDVRYLCLTQDTAAAAPGICYFDNPYFDEGIAAWTVSGDAQAMPGGGSISIQDGGTFAQDNIHLFPDDGGPHDYTLTIKISGFSAVGYTPPPDAVAIRFTYTWGGSPVTIGDLDLTADTTPTTVSTTISVSSETDETMTITGLFLDNTDADIGDANLLIFVDSACLSSDSFPGNGGGGVGPIFPESCSVVSQPTDELLSSWTLYHWHNLNRFFQCDLMKLLNKMYMLMANFFQTLAYALRYWIVVMQQGVSWLGSQFLPWLGSHLSNIATPRIVVNAGELPPGVDENCHDIWCVIASFFDNIAGVLGSLAHLGSDIINGLTQLGSDLIRGVTQLGSDIVNGIVHIASDLIAFFSHIIDVVASLLGLIINGAITIILVVITRVFALLQQGLGLLQALLTGYQTATPSAPFGLPNCDQIDPLTNGTCGVFWLLNNTLFAPGAIGAELLTLFIAVASIMLIIWIIEEIMTMVVTINEVS